MQKDEATGYMKPVHLASRVMIIGEKKFSPLEQAICALMFATMCFCSYLLPRKFTIILVEDTFPYALQHARTFARILKLVSRL